MAWWNVWAAFWGELNTPDSFYDRPWEGGANQAVHWLMGAMAVSVVCTTYAAIFGEMPYRWPTGVALVTLYLVGIEYAKQGWSHADSVVDSAFFTLGVTTVLASLSEMSVRPEIYLRPNLLEFGVSLLCSLAALALYIYPRAKRKYGRTP